MALIKNNCMYLNNNTTDKEGQFLQVQWQKAYTQMQLYINNLTMEEERLSATSEVQWQKACATVHKQPRYGRRKVKCYFGSTVAESLCNCA
jgi:hypothetical protein